MNGTVMGQPARMASNQGNSRQRAILALFAVSLLANAGWTAWHFSLWTVPALLLGWYVADLMSGLIHMIMDYRPCPPGKRLDELFYYEGSRESAEYLALFQARMGAINAFERVVYDFKNHHPRPDALGRRPLWRLIGSTIIVAALPVSLAVNLAIVLRPDMPSWIAAYFVAFLTGGAFAQYFHGSLHRRENPWFINVARSMGLLMTPAAHQLHHDTLQRDFATNCGWSNPVINRLFRALRRRGYLDDAGLEPSS
jgi:hypothetical protein